jgi:hypothetical protein
VTVVGVPQKTDEESVEMLRASKHELAVGESLRSVEFLALRGYAYGAAVSQTQAPSTYRAKWIASSTARKLTQARLPS